MARVTTPLVRDRELQKLVDAAARSNEAERERAEQPAASEAPEPARPNPIRFGVYARMHSGAPGMLWYLPLALIVGLVMFAGARWFQVGALVYAGAFAIRIAIYVVGLVRGWSAFKRFPAGLSFELRGWLSMLDERLVADPEDWQRTGEIAVEVRPGADRAVVEAALDLLLPQANRRFYPSDGAVIGASGDPRVKWTRDGLRASGSLNVWVLGALYRAILQLEWIQRRAGGISRVTLTRSGSIYQISRPSAD